MGVWEHYMYELSTGKILHDKALDLTQLSSALSADQLNITQI